MLKLAVLLFCGFIAVSLPLSPRDLIDEVDNQLEELKNIVEGDILAAHDDLDDFLYDFQTNAQNLADTGRLEMQQQTENNLSQLTIIKDLAMSAGKDITMCTDAREDLLHRLLENYMSELNLCIVPINYRVLYVLRDARYVVDVLMNKVLDLEYQVRQCRGDLLCLAPLLTEIQLNKIRLPQNIGTEVQASESIVDLEKISAQTCSDTYVSAYISQTYAILADILSCADAIIGSRGVY